MSKKRSGPKPLRCKDIADLLIKTYRPSIIDSFTHKLKTACEQEALEIISKSDNYMHGRRRGRKVLAQLINNRKNPYTKVDFIGGPFNITHHWSNKYKKEIYIFGEHHDEIVDCPSNPDLNITNIEDFLRYIFFINPIVFSDFLLEMQAHVVPDGYPEYEYNPSRMNILRSLFGRCIGPERTAPENAPFCQNSRMHFFDIRQGKVKLGINSASLFDNEIQHFVFKIKEELKVKGSEPEEYCVDTDFLNKITEFIWRWKSFFYFFARYNDELNNRIKHKKFWYDQLHSFNLVKKEITVMHTDVRPLLNIFIKKELDELLSFDYTEVATHSRDVLNMYKRIQEFNNEGFVKDTRYIEYYGLKYEDINFLIESINSVFSKELSEFNALISDAYLLARIFKTFQIDDPERYNPRETDEPAEPHNIIIYAGNGHSQRYRKFLNYLGFRLLEHSNELENPLPDRTNCLDMSRITQPLFSYCPYGMEDNPMDRDYFSTDYFGNPISYSSFDSFESVFMFDIPIPFNQPFVPDDLSTSVSVEQGQYGKTKGLRNKPTPSYSRAGRNAKRN